MRILENISSFKRFLKFKESKNSLTELFKFWLNVEQAIWKELDFKDQSIEYIKLLSLVKWYLLFIWKTLASPVDEIILSLRFEMRHKFLSPSSTQYVEIKRFSISSQLSSTASARLFVFFKTSATWGKG